MRDEHRGLWAWGEAYFLLRDVDDEGGNEGDDQCLIRHQLELAS